MFPIGNVQINVIVFEPCLLYKYLMFYGCETLLYLGNYYKVSNTILTFKLILCQVRLKNKEVT